MSKAYAALQLSLLLHRHPPEISGCCCSSTPGGHSVEVTLHQLAIMHGEEALLPDARHFPVKLGDWCTASIRRQNLRYNLEVQAYHPMESKAPYSRSFGGSSALKQTDETSCCSEVLLSAKLQPDARLTLQRGCPRCHFLL